MVPLLSFTATLVDFGGTLIVVASAIRCLLRYLRSRGNALVLERLHRELAASLVFALSLKSGAGIIRTVTVASWHQVGSVAAIIGLRFFLGRVLKAQGGPPSAANPPPSSARRSPPTSGE